MTDKLLSEDDYKKILQRRFNEPEIKFVKAEIKPLSENVEGFMGEHYKLKITYELNGVTDIENFFIKTSPENNQTQKEILEAVNVYEKEIFLYDFLLREYEKYGYDTSFAPKCYYCIPDKTMVLEDVTLRNFNVSKRHTLFDLEQCKSALNSLALFHGAALAYEKEKEKELGKPFTLESEYPQIMDEMFFVHQMEATSKKKEMAEEWTNTSINVFLHLVDLLPEKEDFKEELKKLLKEMTGKIGEGYVKETKFKKTLGHGDLWSNNMFFRNNKDRKDCILVDYQLLRYFYPAFDVLLAIHSNTNSTFRKKHLETLLRFYYDTLTEIVQKYGYDLSEILPEKEFRESLDLVLLDVQFQAYATQSFVFLPEKVLNDNMTSGDEATKELMFGDSRNQMSIDAFNKDQVYRDLATDDLHEFRKTILKLKQCE